jgi:hypothetical protein
MVIHQQFERHRGIIHSVNELIDNKVTFEKAFLQTLSTSISFDYLFHPFRFILFVIHCRPSHLVVTFLGQRAAQHTSKMGVGIAHEGTGLQSREVNLFAFLVTHGRVAEVL